MVLVNCDDVLFNGNPLKTIMQHCYNTLIKQCKFEPLIQWFNLKREQLEHLLVVCSGENCIKKYSD